MSTELENAKEQFLDLLKQEDVLQMREFLNDQNISEVAELINEFPEYSSQIIGNMSIHRASSVFKILSPVWPK